jgi:hypothetical protein
MAEQPKVETRVQVAGSGHGRERKPYVAPTLRRLGSVRDLTLGSVTGSLAEANVKFPRKMAM